MMLRQGRAWPRPLAVMALLCLAALVHPLDVSGSAFLHDAVVWHGRAWRQVAEVGKVHVRWEPAGAVQGSAGGERQAVGAKHAPSHGPGAQALVQALNATCERCVVKAWLAALRRRQASVACSTYPLLPPRPTQAQAWAARANMQWHCCCATWHAVRPAHAPQRLATLQPRPPHHCSRAGAAETLDRVHISQHLCPAVAGSAGQVQRGGALFLGALPARRRRSCGMCLCRSSGAVGAWCRRPGKWPGRAQGAVADAQRLASVGGPPEPAAGHAQRLGLPHPQLWRRAG